MRLPLVFPSLNLLLSLFLNSLPRHGLFPNLNPFLSLSLFLNLPLPLYGNSSRTGNFP